jgi:hypothetical protein
MTIEHVLGNFCGKHKKRKYGRKHFKLNEKFFKKITIIN